MTGAAGGVVTAQGASVVEDLTAVRLLTELDRVNLLPAILFRTSRRQCDTDIDRLVKLRYNRLTPTAQAQILKALDVITLRYAIDRAVLEAHPQYRVLIEVGAGAHHAGQLLVWRLVLEELMSRGLLRLLIATGTVAAGVDFPARTVIITAHSKRGSNGFQVLSSAEFQQMSGRAGRRGKDLVGFCLVAPGPFSDARVIAEITKKQAEPLRSAYFAAPSTVLNLLKHRNVDDLRFTVERSLAAFLDRKSAVSIRAEGEAALKALANSGLSDGERRAARKGRRRVREADDLAARQSLSLEASLSGLSTLGYVENGSLTEKGTWAAELCTSLVLELAEAIESGIFEGTSPLEMAGIVAAIAGDPHRAYFGLKKNPIRKDRFGALENIVKRVRAAYQNPVTSELKVLPDASLTVMTWMECDDWLEFASLLTLAGVAAGDVARLVSQTADHLNQINRLHKTHPLLAQTADRARYRLLRPPLSEALAVVDTEKISLAE